MGVCLWLIVFPSFVNAAPVLGSDTLLSTAGYFRLSWSAPSAQGSVVHRYELQQADSEDFYQPQTIYAGHDEASVISGLSDQVYFYRVTFEGSRDWSEPLRVEVKHHSLTRAVVFFALGSLMFVVLLFVLIRGVCRSAVQ